MRHLPRSLTLHLAPPDPALGAAVVEVHPDAMPREPLNQDDDGMVVHQVDKAVGDHGARRPGIWPIDQLYAVVDRDSLRQVGAVLRIRRVYAEQVGGIYA